MDKLKKCLAYQQTRVPLH